MSDLAFPDRPRGLALLALGLLLGPVAALANQQSLYAAASWSCGHGARGALHLIPALALVLTIGAGVTAHGIWRDSGRSLEDEHGPAAATRTHFLSLLGMAVSALSALVIVAQWVAVFAFDPCMRA